MTHEEEKVPLRIALQEEFKEDTVAIWVNSEPVYRKSGVSTNWSAGLADTLEVMVPRGPVTVRIELPERNLSKTEEFSLAEPVYLRVNVIQDVIEVERSSKRMLYY